MCNVELENNVLLKPNTLSTLFVFVSFHNQSRILHNFPELKLKFDFLFPVRKHPIEVFDQLFFAVFGQSSPELLQANPKASVLVDSLFRLLFGIYMLVSVIVLMNLLIAMMTDTYVRIQAQSDIEWKFGLSKLVRSMHRTTSAPSPFNLITTWSLILIDFCRTKVKQRSKRPNLIRMVNTLQDKHLSPRSRAAAKWLSKINKKSKIIPEQELIPKPIPIHSPAGSHMDFVLHTTRIDFVTEWDLVSKKYRDLTRYAENEEENN